MACYMCNQCGEMIDDDYNHGTDDGEGLVCEDCCTEIAAAFEEELGREPGDDTEMFAWAKEAY